MPKLILRDHYAVLGVHRDATVEVIKKAYRARAKELHPDLLGEDATPEEIDEAEALFNEATEAYDALKDEELRKDLDSWLVSQVFGAPSDPDFSYSAPRPRPERPPVPTPDRFEHEGAWIYVVYELDYFGDYVTATVQVSINDVFKIQTEPTLPHENATIARYEVVDGKGEVVGFGYSIKSMRDRYRRFRAEESRNKDRRSWKSRLEELQRQRDELAASGLPVSALDSLLHKARAKEAGAFQWEYSDSVTLAVFAGFRQFEIDPRGHRYGHSRDSVKQAIREVEKEIERLGATDVSDALLEDLLAGRITHPDVRFNNEIIAALDVLSIRTGGEIERLTEESVRDHYRQRLQGVTADRLLVTDLRLPDDREIIDEMIAEGILDLSPETVEISGNKKSSYYSVEYYFDQKDGELVPVGVVTVPLAVYEKNCSKCGVKSNFPVLPHGIQLLIRVKVSNDPVVISDAYPDGQELKTEVERCIKRKARRGVPPAEEAPPWFVGRIRRP